MSEQVGPADFFADQPLCPELIQPECLDKTPVESGSFTYTRISHLKITPTDYETGVTLPTISNRKLPPIGRSCNSQGVVIADWNHSYHPKERLRKGTPLEQALRSARVEWVHRDDHNAYHKEFFGPEIGNEQAQIKQIIFSAAGYVPSQGLQYDGREEAKIITLSPRKRSKLWVTGSIKISNIVPLRDGLMDVALKKDFNGVNSSTIDEFLHTTDLGRRFVLGSNLLSMALSDVTTPLRPLYKEMHEKQQLRPDAPKNIGRFALKLVSQYKRTRAFGILQGHLLAN